MNGASLSSCGEGAGGRGCPGDSPRIGGGGGFLGKSVIRFVFLSVRYFAEEEST